jgi:serine/threonine protein phosphatase PrpC
MGVTARWRSAIATDPGLVRESNEDRCFTDDERGVFLVVDGIGGHAGGEIAAELAVDTIRLALLGSRGSAASRVRSAITEANNVIHKTADANPAWHGMSCVLTLALVEENRVTVGHVGDSRLYLIWNGAIRKLTSDQSPVGEQEEAGVLTESEAMRHPRRNEVFVDVGSQPRQLRDEFIQIRELEFKPDAALLLCSDGLSDLLTSADILAVVEKYDGDPQFVPQALVDSALEAGGRDNVSVVFVAGSGFLGSRSTRMLEARQRLSVTRARGGPLAEAKPRRPRTPLLFACLCFLLGLILGLAGGYVAATFAPWMNPIAPDFQSHAAPSTPSSMPSPDNHAH